MCVCLFFSFLFFFFSVCKFRTCNWNWPVVYCVHVWVDALFGFCFCFGFLFLADAILVNKCDWAAGRKQKLRAAIRTTFGCGLIVERNWAYGTLSVANLLHIFHFGRASYTFWPYEACLLNLSFHFLLFLLFPLLLSNGFIMSHWEYLAQ